MTTQKQPYRCVLSDPPWPEYGGGKSKRGADKHFKLLKPMEIAAVMHAHLYSGPSVEGSTFPSARVDRLGCHLWMWVTNSWLPSGINVMSLLGFRYITNLVWTKPNFGLGQYLRGQHELLLFGVLGKLPSMSRSKGTVVAAKKRGHSVKPDEVYEVIEAVSPGPRLEMFARRRREGWDCWGDQAPEAPADNVTLLSSDGG